MISSRSLGLRFPQSYRVGSAHAITVDQATYSVKIAPPPPAASPLLLRASPAQRASAPRLAQSAIATRAAQAHREVVGGGSDDLPIVSHPRCYVLTGPAEPQGLGSGLGQTQRGLLPTATLSLTPHASARAPMRAPMRAAAQRCPSKEGLPNAIKTNYNRAKYVTFPYRLAAASGTPLNASTQRRFSAFRGEHRAVTPTRPPYAPLCPLTCLRYPSNYERTTLCAPCEHSLVSLLCSACGRRSPTSRQRLRPRLPQRPSRRMQRLRRETDTPARSRAAAASSAGAITGLGNLAMAPRTTAARRWTCKA